MPQLFILHESISGFAVFRTTEFEEIAIFLPQVRRSLNDISKFRSIAFLIAFQKFENQKNALQNLRSIASDELSCDLQLFLENNIPRSKKSKQAVVLGVETSCLASAISEKLGINCVTSEVVKEIKRGIRLHFSKLIKGFVGESYLRQNILSAAHQWGQNKTNFSIQDNFIIANHNLIDEFEKDIRKSTQRIKGWYSLHFPELHNFVGDDAKLYVTCVSTIGDRKKMTQDVEEKLNSFVNDSSTVKAIMLAAHNSMGVDISSVDLENLLLYCKRVLSLIEVKETNIENLKTKMKATAPNMSSIVGELVGSKLISQAGGLHKLVKLPASTVQILGAEKKLFRQKKTICGVLSQSTVLNKINKRNKSRMARMIAFKCSLAAKVDYFKKTSDETFCNRLLTEIEKTVQMREKIKPENKNSSERVMKKMPEGKVAEHVMSKITEKLDNSRNASVEVNGSLHLSEIDAISEDTEKNKRSKHIADDVDSKDANCEAQKIFSQEINEDSEHSELSCEDISDMKQPEKKAKNRKMGIALKRKNAMNDAVSDKKDSNYELGKTSEEDEENINDLELSSNDVSEMNQVKKTTKRKKSVVNDDHTKDVVEEKSEMPKKRMSLRNRKKIC